MKIPRASWFLPLLIVACRAPGDEMHSIESGDAAEHGPAVAPMDLDGEHETTIAFLLSRHDADGDGEITAQEYSRSETTFERLDKNGDGVISEGDWQRRAPRDGRSQGGSTMERMRTMKATGAVAMYFQQDDPGTMTLDELEAAIAEYDTNDDGQIAVDEFTCAFEGKKVELPGNIGRSIARMGIDDPWETIVGSVDKDGDGVVARTELSTFFVEADGNGDGIWTFSQPPGGGASGGERAARPARSERPEAPPVGVIAPDFTLTSPDGSNSTTLSSFAGKQPVALIFGSYT